MCRGDREAASDSVICTSILAMFPVGEPFAADDGRHPCGGVLNGRESLPSPDVGARVISLDTPLLNAWMFQKRAREFGGSRDCARLRCGVWPINFFIPREIRACCRGLLLRFLWSVKNRSLWLRRGATGCVSLAWWNKKFSVRCRNFAVSKEPSIVSRCFGTITANFAAWSRRGLSLVHMRRIVPRKHYSRK